MNVSECGKGIEVDEMFLNINELKQNIKAKINKRAYIFNKKRTKEQRSLFFFFFYLGFLSRTFTNHRTAREGGGHFFNSSLPLPPASQTLRH